MPTHIYVYMNTYQCMRFPPLAIALKRIKKAREESCTAFDATKRPQRVCLFVV